ncbi:MAG TPA: 50S ribosomal protein L25 [Candidatus Absconditabacterales bacterium]|nr:50S ribosomal protein L25 [Candidatus Absconditabacterales bacterium]HNG97493.1 50S ribosomal protein L25 [Candidatus Absconditabacterales bacterium]
MELVVQSRVVAGKKSSLLRAKGLIPGIIYGRHLDSAISVAFPKNEFLKLYKKAGTSTVVDVTGGADQMVLIHDIQVDHITNNLLHVDFLAVKADQEVSAQVPVVLVGESPLVKGGEGRIDLLRDSITVTALPRKLPHEISLDISKIITLDDGIFVRDLNLGEGVTVDEDGELPIVVAVEIESGEEEASTTTTTDATTTDATTDKK